MHFEKVVQLLPIVEQEFNKYGTGVIVQHLLGTAVLEKQFEESNPFVEQIQIPQIAIDDKERNKLSVPFPATSSNDWDKKSEIDLFRQYKYHCCIEYTNRCNEIRLYKN
ncbi:MAG: hypothetical protein EZS28_046352 [Streblomastix strix]|uniref:Uncharacterized protein n=1 Tax=Streblomastix strix TaxID=222440 RepID=A0A5J4TKT1_9EUKA|nr:MAG: hypothetical protein EZS28_046352 [Streblomastix strix]